MLNVVRIWILLSALCCAGGWVLSYFHALDRAGYSILFAVGIAAGLLLWRSDRSPNQQPSRPWKKILRRFRKPAPFFFLLLAVFSLVGGLFYIPHLHITTSADTDGYKVPRVLQWLGHNGWFWIKAFDDRLNVPGTGFEWLSAPIILFTRTDRWIFLINIVSYLLLPGLIFSVFTRLSVRPRLAWWWTWWISAGWCYAMQAGSACNDSFAAIYALAAVDFALRARETGRVTDVWFSMLAAALIGTKQVEIPLVLLWMVAVLPVLRLLLLRPIRTLGVALWSALASPLPLMFFDYNYTGSPMGNLANIGQLYHIMPLKSPFWGIVGNVFSLSFQNLQPPIFPGVERWNEMMARFVQTPFGSHFAAFEEFGRLAPAISEASAGVGLAIVLLVAISVWWAWRCRGMYSNVRGMAENWVPKLLRVVPWLLLLLCMAKIGTRQNARHLSPYYVFLFPTLLLLPGQSLLTRRHWWKLIGYGSMAGTALLLVVSFVRPLFPAETIFAQLHERYPQSKFFTKAWFSYVNRDPVNQFKQFLATNVPPDESVIGYLTTIGRVEPAMWFPLGERRVERLLPEQSVKELHDLGVHYVVIDDRVVKEHRDIQPWMNDHDARPVAQMAYARDHMDDFSANLYLVKLHFKTETALITD